MKIILFVTTTLVLFTATVAFAAGEQINWQVLSNGGTEGTSTGYTLSGTVGQTAVGMGSTTSYTVNHGFWQDFSTGECCVNRGNVDGETGPAGPIDVADLTYLVTFLFTGGNESPCPEEGNVDGKDGPAGPIDVSDLTYLVAFLFTGGSAPPDC